MSHLAYDARRLSAAVALASIVTAVPAAIAIAQPTISRMPGVGPAPTLPEPHHSPSAVHFSRVIGWPEGRTPVAPEGFEVNAFATGLDSPRWLYVLPNGDVLVAEARTLPRSDLPAEMLQGLAAAGSVGVSPNRVTLLRDADGDGSAEIRETFLENLNQPFGMALVGDELYVANTDGVVRFPYEEGQTRIDAPGQLILTLPAGGYNNHWTRNIICDPRWAEALHLRRLGQQHRRVRHGRGGPPREYPRDQPGRLGREGLRQRAPQSERHGLAARDGRPLDGGE